MPTRPRGLFRPLLRLGLVGAGAVGCLVAVTLLVPPRYVPTRLDKVAWRARVLSRKVTGGVAELSLEELVFMRRVKGGFGLESYANDELGLQGAVGNAFI